MKTYKAYKTELDPNNVQRTLLNKHAGTARFAWNWALNRINENKSKPNAFVLSKEFNTIKKEQFPWAYDVSKWVLQDAFKNIENGFNRFFKPDKSGNKAERPKFKSKHKNKKSFSLYESKNTIEIKNNKIKLPRLGWIKLKEQSYIPQDKKAKSATCSERAGKWFVSVLIEEEIQDKPIENNTVIGVDLGIKTLLTCSDGTVFENPKAYRKAKKQFRKIQKRMSRQQKGSKRRDRTKKRLSKQHYRISCIRNDAIHKATSWVVKTKQPKLIVLEKLNVSGMMKNHKLAGAIQDAAFYEIRRQFEYKQKWNGGEVFLIDRFYPSSKTCSCCGWIKKDLTLNDRIFVCEKCGLVIDRDLNSGKNLENRGTQFIETNKEKLMSVGLTANAHGEITVVEQSLRSENQIVTLNGGT